MFFKEQKHVDTQKQPFCSISKAVLQLCFSAGTDFMIFVNHVIVLVSKHVHVQFVVSILIFKSNILMVLIFLISYQPSLSDTYIRTCPRHIAPLGIMCIILYQAKALMPML